MTPTSAVDPSESHRAERPGVGDPLFGVCLRGLKSWLYLASVPHPPKREVGTGLHWQQSALPLRGTEGKLAAHRTHLSPIRLRYKPNWALRTIAMGVVLASQAESPGGPGRGLTPTSVGDPLYGTDRAAWTWAGVDSYYFGRRSL